MEFVKITFPTTETIYDSVAVAIEAIPSVQVSEETVVPFTEQMSALWSLGKDLVTSVSSRPVHFRKVALEEWSSSPPSNEEP
tara:strand:- start:254 stop:499 length:246 start_codon:yes stop_codon:yes gene_type:complete